MPSPHKSALIKTVKGRHLKAIRKSRNKKDKLYQDWLVWTCGGSAIYTANEYAWIKTKEQWQRLYSETLTRSRLFHISMVRLYLSATLSDYFKTTELAFWAMDKGLVPQTWKSVYVRRKQFLYFLVQYHYINQVENKKAYVLTQRAKLLLSTYERYLKEYIQPSQVAQ